MTRENVEKVMAALEKKGYDAVIFGLTDKGYEILALNVAKIKAMTEQQQAKIKAYEEYYMSQNKKLDEMERLQEQKIEDAKTKNKEVKEGSLLNQAKRFFGGN